MDGLASWRIEQGVAILTLDNPPVNAISRDVRAAIVAGVARAEADPEVTALVLACAGRTFFAGADLKEFGKPSLPPYLTEVVDTIEASAKPIVAAIHGTALGGGLEIAMACHYRVATADAKLGLPEVKLALMPGARGTQQLPRLVGVETALDMIALGETVSAIAALAMGLIDVLAEVDLLATARDKARAVSEEAPRRTRDLVAEKVDDALYAEFAARHARKFRGLDAPPAIIAAVRAATELPFGEGARREREIFLKLREGPQNAAMRHAFFAEREAAKVPGLAAAAARPVTTAGIVGAGTMGTGIALALLSADIPVVLFERDPAALERGAARIRAMLADNARSGRMDEAAARAAADRLTLTLDIAAIGDADLVVEAAFEALAVKRAIFADLDRVARRGAVLATNTSYLDVDAIAAATTRAPDVLGLHFFSPANVMKLLEIVRGRETAADVLATGLALAKRIGKVAVVAGNAHGFIGNRMLAVRRREAEAMIAEGATPQQVDRVLERFGFPMGPFRMADLAGLDLGWNAAASRGATIRERLNETGRHGQKAGAGFYDYGVDRKAMPSSAADAIVAEFARDRGIDRRAFGEAEILDRLLWPMVDEGARLLAEGVAQRASDIDVVWLNGYGWPRWTGGPMFHARATGIDLVCRRLETLGIQPSAALRTLSA